MITATDVVEAKIRAVVLHDGLERVLAELVGKVWAELPYDVADCIVLSKAKLAPSYRAAVADYREADFAAARLEAQRADEQAAGERKLVLDASSFWGRRGSEAGVPPAGMLSASDLAIIADALERVLRGRLAQPAPPEWRERCEAALAIVRGVHHDRQQ